MARDAAIPADLMPLPCGPAPQIAPDLEILTVLGRIGDGIVYLAKNNGRAVRLREYGPAWTAQRGEWNMLYPRHESLSRAWYDGARRFVEQGKKLAALDHRAIGKVWEVIAGMPAEPPSSQDAATPQGGYTIGPPVAKPLSAALGSEGGKASAEFVASLARALAQVLDAIHRSGLTHLDICPETIALTPMGMSLVDFAVDNRPLMRPLGNQRDLVRPGYAPIELCDGTTGMPLDARTDIYSASATLFRAITGRALPPWEDRLKSRTLPGLGRAEGHSRQLIEGIIWGLQIEPQARPASAAEWSAALFGTTAAPRVAARQPERATVAPVPVRPWSRLAAPVLIIGIVAVVLTTMLTNNWFGSDGGPAENRTSENMILVTDAPVENELFQIEPVNQVAAANPPVQEAPPAEPRPPSALIGGLWHRPADSGCATPLRIEVDGGQLRYVREGITFTERIDLDEGSTLRATVTAINGRPAAPRQFEFSVENGGTQLRTGDELWLPC